MGKYLDSAGLAYFWSKVKSKMLLTNSKMLTTNPFAPPSMRGPYISKIDNGFYAADKRWDISGTGITANLQYLFDGNYETYSNVAEGATGVITMDFSSTTYFPGYPYGYILINFYYNQTPTDVSVRVYCNWESQGVGWKTLTTSPVSDNDTTHCTYQAYNPYYNISEIEITVVAQETKAAWISQVELAMDRPHSSRNPFVTKYGAETLYYPLTAPTFIGTLDGKLATARTFRTNLASTSAASFDGSANVTPGVTGTLPVGNGGTGQTSANAAANAFANALTMESSTPVDADYFISQHVGGGTTTTTYHRRPMSALWDYIEAKIGEVSDAVTGVKGSAESAYRTGDVNISAANIGAIDTAGTGLSKSGTTLNHSNSVTAGTAGTSSATSGTNTLAVPYVTYDAQGHVTASGTHTHTIGNASTSAYGVTKLSSSTSSTSTTLAATPSAVKSAYDLANTANTKAKGFRATFTNGSNGVVVSDSADGWKTITEFTTIEASNGTISNYFTFSNGIITANQACTLRISAELLWRSKVTGNFGIDVYDGSIERSVFVTKMSVLSSSSGDWVSVCYPARVFTLAAGDTLTVRRWNLKNIDWYAAYRSWLTIEVTG